MLVRVSVSGGESGRGFSGAKEVLKGGGDEERRVWGERGRGLCELRVERNLRDCSLV